MHSVFIVPLLPEYSTSQQALPCSTLTGTPGRLNNDLEREQDHRDHDCTHTENPRDIHKTWNQSCKGGQHSMKAPNGPDRTTLATTHEGNNKNVQFFPFNPCHKAGTTCAADRYDVRQTGCHGSCGQERPKTGASIIESAAMTPFLVLPIA